MDRLLHPNRFETEPTAPTAEKLNRHWKITLMNYLEQADANTVTHTPAAVASAEQAAAAVSTTPAAQETHARTDRRKFFALVNNISANVYELINDVDS